MRCQRPALAPQWRRRQRPAAAAVVAAARAAPRGLTIHYDHDNTIGLNREPQPGSQCCQLYYCCKGLRVCRTLSGGAAIGPRLSPTDSGSE